MGFLEAHRPAAQGPEALYRRRGQFLRPAFARARRQLHQFRPDLCYRRKLRALGVQPILSEAPVIVEGHAFTTGAVPRTSLEHVLPNTWVQYGVMTA